mgnify:CR=1 FL=1
MAFRRYREGQKIDSRRVKPHHAAIYFVFGVISLGLGLLYFQSRSQSPDVDASKNNPISSTVGSNQDGYKPFKHPLYLLKLPSDWVEVERVSDTYNNYIVYENTHEINTGRELAVHIDRIRKPETTRIIPVEVESKNIIAGDISPQCHSFTDFTGVGLDQPRLAKWQGVEFMCDPNKVINTIGIASQSGMGVELTHAGKKHTYYLIFTDHSAHPDTSIFYNILDSFKVI